MNCLLCDAGMTVDEHIKSCKHGVRCEECRTFDCPACVEAAELAFLSAVYPVAKPTEPTFKHMFGRSRDREIARELGYGG